MSKIILAPNVTKQILISNLRAFVRQRPGFDLGNYATMNDYRRDYRGTLKDRDSALELLRFIANTNEITLDIMHQKAGNRLTFGSSGAVDYCTGQYWCVEYRRAVVCLCKDILWEYFGNTREFKREVIKQCFKEWFTRSTYNNLGL